MLDFLLGLTLASTIVIGSFAIIEQIQKVEAANELRDLMIDVRNASVMYAFKEGAPPKCTYALLGRSCEDGEPIEGASSYLNLSASRYGPDDIKISRDPEQPSRVNVDIDVSSGLAERIVSRSLSLNKTSDGVGMGVVTSAVPQNVGERIKETAEDIKGQKRTQIELRDQYFRHPFTKESDIRNFESAFMEGVPSDWRWKWQQGSEFVDHKPGYPNYVKNIGPPVSHCGHFGDRSAGDQQTYLPVSLYFDRNANQMTQNEMFRHCFKDQYEPVRVFSPDHMRYLLAQGYSQDVLLKITAKIERGRARLTRNFPTPQITEGEGGIRSSSIGRYVRGLPDVQLHSWHRFNAKELREATPENPVIARVDSNLSEHKTWSRIGADHYPNVPPWDGITFREWQEVWDPDPRFWMDRSESPSTALSRLGGDAFGMRYALWYEGGTEEEPGALYIQYRQNGVALAEYAFREVQIESTRGKYHPTSITWNDGSQPNVDGARGLGHIQLKTDLVLMPNNERVKESFRSGSESVRERLEEANERERRLERQFDIEKSSEKTTARTASDEKSGITVRWSRERARPGIQNGEIAWSDPILLTNGQYSRFLAGVGQSFTDAYRREFYVLSGENATATDFLDLVDQPLTNESGLLGGMVKWGDFCSGDGPHLFAAGQDGDFATDRKSDIFCRTETLNSTFPQWEQSGMNLTGMSAGAAVVLPGDVTGLGVDSVVAIGRDAEDNPTVVMHSTSFANDSSDATLEPEADGETTEEEGSGEADEPVEESTESEGGTEDDGVEETAPEQDGKSSVTISKELPVTGVSDGDIARGDFDNDGTIELVVTGYDEEGIGFDEAEPRLYIIDNLEEAPSGVTQRPVQLEYESDQESGGLELDGIGGGSVEPIDMPPRSGEPANGGMEFLISGDAGSDAVEDERQERSILAVVDFDVEEGEYFIHHHPAGSHRGLEPDSNGDMEVTDLNNDSVADVVLCGRLSGARAPAVGVYYGDRVNRRLKPVNAYYGSLRNCSISAADYGVGPTDETVDYRGDGDVDFTVTGFNPSRDRTQINIYRNQLTD